MNFLFNKKYLQIGRKAKVAILALLVQPRLYALFLNRDKWKEIAKRTPIEKKPRGRFIRACMCCNIL